MNNNLRMNYVGKQIKPSFLMSDRLRNFEKNKVIKNRKTYEEPEISEFIMFSATNATEIYN